jgi:hypothetical protein
MTSHHDPPSPRRARTPHSLTSPDHLADQLTHQWGDPAVAAYALAARALAEEHPEVGRVDTWRRLVLKIMRDRALARDGGPRRQPPLDRVGQRRMRKKLSWHFTSRSRGPAWQQVTLLVRHLVPGEQQPAVLARLAALHAAARGHHPEPGRVTACDPEAVPAVAPGPEAALVELLRRQQDELRRELAASRAENQRLRAVIDGTGPAGRSGQRGGPGRPADAPAPRTARNSGHFPGCGGPDESPRSRDREPARVDLSTPGGSGTGEPRFWIDQLWHGAHRAPSDRPVPGRGTAGGTAPNGSADRYPPLRPYDPVGSPVPPEPSA